MTVNVIPPPPHTHTKELHTFDTFYSKSGNIIPCFTGNHAASSLATEDPDPGRHGAILKMQGSPSNLLLNYFHY